MAINMAKYIDDLGLDDLEVLRRKLSSRYFPHRGSTLYTFQKLLERHRSIDPRVLEFCSSEKLVEQVRRMRREDPDFAARMAGRALPSRPPAAAALAAGLIWAVAVALVAAGWWTAAIVVAAWAGVISGALMYRCRPARRTPPI